MGVTKSRTRLRDFHFHSTDEKRPGARFAPGFLGALVSGLGATISHPERCGSRGLSRRGQSPDPSRTRIFSRDSKPWGTTRAAMRCPAPRVSHASLTPLLDSFILSAKNTGLTGCPHPQHSFLTFSPARPHAPRIVIDFFILPEQTVQRTPTLCQQVGLGCQGPPSLPSGSNQQVACW